MKLRVTFALAFLFLAPVLGCGSPSPPPAAKDDPNLPAEVRETEAKFEADSAKRVEDLKKKSGRP